MLLTTDAAQQAQPIRNEGVRSLLKPVSMVKTLPTLHKGAPSSIAHINMIRVSQASKEVHPHKTTSQLTLSRALMVGSIAMFHLSVLARDQLEIQTKTLQSSSRFLKTVSSSQLPMEVAQKQVF